MAKLKLSSVIVFGIDLGPNRSSAESTIRESLVGQLVAMFQRHQIPASWAISNLSARELPLIRAASAPHEIMLMIDAPAAHAKIDAFQSAASLRATVLNAARCGIQLRSLAVDPRVSIPYQTLSRVGIRTLRPIRTSAIYQPSPVQALPLRYGLWSLPVSYYWPHPRRIVQRYAARQLLYHVQLAAQRGHALQIVVDLPTLVADGDSSLPGLERLLGLVGQLRSQNALLSCRLADVERIARHETLAQPARSILRRVG